jgi:hypothetical protein
MTDDEWTLTIWLVILVALAAALILRLLGVAS